MADIKKIDDGGPAYPQNDLSAYGLGPSERGEHGSSGEPEDFGTRRYTVEGMSLRNWFAGQALVGLIPPYTAAYGSPTAACMEIAQEAYGYADIMIAARKGGA